MKILIVDDSAVIIDYTKAILEKHGHTVLTSNNAWVSNIISSEKPEVVLMDMNLGAVNGVDAIKSLKGRKFSEGILYFLHSSEPLDKLIEYTKACNADGYIVKTVDERTFMSHFNLLMSTMGKK
jgi:twitching motility two-component system response regulator PilH